MKPGRRKLRNLFKSIRKRIGIRLKNFFFRFPIATGLIFSAGVPRPCDHLLKTIVLEGSPRFFCNLVAHINLGHSHYLIFVLHTFYVMIRVLRRFFF